MDKVNSNSRFQALRQTGDDGNGVQNQPQQVNDNHAAPTPPRLRDPGNVRHLGFGTMLKIKFQALKTAIKENDIGSYAALKEDAKLAIRKDRLTRSEEAATRNTEFGTFETKQSATRSNLFSGNLNALSVQLDKLVEQCQQDGGFDLQTFTEKTTQLIRKGFSFKEYSEVDLAFLKSAAQTFKEQAATIDPARQSKADAAQSLVTLLERCADPQGARDIFHGEALTQIRTAKPTTFLRQNLEAAPFMFMSAPLGGKQLLDQGTGAIARLRDGDRFSRLNEEMGSSRLDEKGDRKPFKLSDGNITTAEANQIFDIAAEIMEQFFQNDPTEELKDFMAEMTHEINLAHPDKTTANALTNTLFVDQLALRAMNPAVTSTFAKGDTHSLGMIITTVLQLAANKRPELAGGSPEVQEVARTRLPQLTSRFNDICVEKFGMPPESHVDYRTEEQHALAEMSDQQVGALIQGLVGNLPPLPNLPQPQVPDNVQNQPPQNQPPENRQPENLQARTRNEGGEDIGDIEFESEDITLEDELDVDDLADEMDRIAKFGLPEDEGDENIKTDRN